MVAKSGQIGLGKALEDDFRHIETEIEESASNKL
jgi:hypothetical protein